MKSFSSLHIENPFKAIQGIKIQDIINDSPRKVSEFQFCRSQPKVRKQPQLFGLSKRTLELIGVDYEEAKKDSETPYILSGSKLMTGSEPLAHNYCGYQFGNWAGQLGDGRAHLLGSIKGPHKYYELQLKGSGVTPFSRFADGNSVVSSAVRQFLASELMAGLGVPTTRAASLVIADEGVKRDPFYDGRIRIEKAAIVLRTAESFLRFGSLEVCLPSGNMTNQNPFENRKIIAPLCDYAIERHFPDIDIYESDPYEQLFKKLVKASAELVAYWQAIGFVHGVMNTDNMSLGGLTIDYGPYAFIDYFSKDYVSNATDEHERYSYRRQPYVLEWNLQQLAYAMDPLFPAYLSLEYLKENYLRMYNDKYYQLMSNKLGLNRNKESEKIIDLMIENMHLCGTHFTNFFRLIEEFATNSAPETMVEAILGQSEPTQFFLKNIRAFHQLMNVDIKEIQEQDPAFNTFLITDQKERIKRKEALQRQNCQDRTNKERKIWHQWVNLYLPERAKSKDKTIRNPKYTILNFLAKQIQREILQMNSEQSVEHLSKILDILSNPFQKSEWFEERYWSKPPIPLKLTCSS